MPTSSSRRTLPVPVALVLQASVILFFLAGSSAPTPLYATYSARWHFSPITTTVVFGIYAIAVLVALLVAGRLSDHVGRRPVLAGAIAAQIVTMLVFVDAHGVAQLMAARVLQGLATGAASGAIGAAMIDLHPTRGTLANAVAPVTGTATGALGSGVLVQWLPAPTHTVYVVLMAVFVLQLAAVGFLPETAPRKPGAVASLRPRFAVPPAVRPSLLAAAPALVAVWSLAGFAGALGPAIVRAVSGDRSPVVGGLPLFLVPATGVVAIVAWQHADPRRAMRRSMAALVAGMAIALIGVAAGSLAGLLLGMAVAGVGFGGGFQAGVRTVLPLASDHERAGVLSVVYVVSYLAMGLPAVIGGVLVVYGGGLVDTAYQYGAAVMVLGTAALVASLRRPVAAPLALAWSDGELADVA